MKGRSDDFLISFKVRIETVLFTCSYFQDGDLSGLVAKDKYQYLPDLADLPDLDLPMELPSLPGTQINLSSI